MFDLRNGENATADGPHRKFALRFCGLWPRGVIRPEGPQKKVGDDE